MKLAITAVFATQCLVASTAHADDTELNRATIVYARGDTVFASTGHGKSEQLLAKASSPIRALHSDSAGKVLLVDVSGTWHWMRLARDKTLTPLPCIDGPIQIAPDGRCLLCRRSGGGVIVNLATGHQTPVAITDAWITGTTVRSLVWADADGIWTAPPATPTRKTKVAPTAPLRGFLPSHDGKRAVGVYSDVSHVDPNAAPRRRVGRQQKPAEMLMSFDLDGTAARRKGIRNGVPLAWSHDDQYVLVQDGTAACLMRANGGQYKCWKNHAAVSLAPDGSYALVVANGSLYRAKLDGPYDEKPTLVTKNVDAAVWVPGR